MRRRGLIVERSGRKITALTPSGEFVTFRSAREDLMPGMEVGLPARGFTGFVWRRFAPALVLSAIMVVISFFSYQQYLHARPLMAYVTLDCAGSVELEVNEAGLVKTATAIDEAGEAALAQVSYLNKPAEKVVNALLQLPEASRTPDVVVAVVPLKEHPRVEGLERKVVEEASKTVPSAEPKSVTSLRLDTETRDSAKELGISAGRAALWALSKHGRQAGGEQVGPAATGEEVPVQGSGRQEEPEETPETAGVDPEQPGQAGGSGEGAETGPPGQGGKATPPGQEIEDVLPGHEGEPASPGQEGKAVPPGQEGEAVPPGQEDWPRGRSSVLDAIKRTLPQLDPDRLKELNERKDAKEKEKYLKEITREWLERIMEKVEEETGRKVDPPGQSKPGKDNEREETRPGKSRGGRRPT